MAPGTPLTVTPDAAHPAINSVTCGALTTRAMNISAGNPTGTLVLNGRQTRVLNVALYPYIPNPTGQAFDNLLDHVIQIYQQGRPEVLLNVQMSFAVDIYDFAALQTALGQGGFDVMEIDTLFIGFLARQRARQSGEHRGRGPALPRRARCFDPQWTALGHSELALHGLHFSRDPAVRNVDTLAKLQEFLQRSPHRERQMAGDYTGSWRLPSMYINAYVQTYGYLRMAEAMRVQPPDPAVIQNIVADFRDMHGRGRQPLHRQDISSHRRAWPRQPSPMRGQARTWAFRNNPSISISPGRRSSSRSRRRYGAIAAAAAVQRHLRDEQRQLPAPIAMCRRFRRFHDADDRGRDEVLYRPIAGPGERVSVADLAGGDSAFLRPTVDPRSSALSTIRACAPPRRGFPKQLHPDGRGSESTIRICAALKAQVAAYGC